MLGVYPGTALFRYQGLLDELKIHAQAVAPPTGLDVELRTLSVAAKGAFAFPNPVSDHATFVVDGIGIQGTLVRVYDLAGHIVFDSGWQDGVTTYEWDARSTSGEPLANGPYIYVIWVRDANGTIEARRPGKLFVRR
jgi:flagellar hook assembly protein FlgD